MRNAKMEAQRLLTELRADLDKLIQHHEAYVQSVGAMAEQQARAAGGPAQTKLMHASRGMQEMNQSFNLQLMNLQASMQNEARQFTMVSNIMKTRHDTAKNAINNIR